MDLTDAYSKASTVEESFKDFATSYAAIIKQEKQEDGSLMVYGKATDDAIDSDNQICDAGWLNKAMPDWFKSGGNIREQHSNIAAGVAKELDSKEDGHYITAHVVDAQSVKKVEAGVLKGFSIGIRAPRIVRDNKAVNGRIIDGSIVEISLVDRPANPNAKLMLAKSDRTDLIQMEEMTENAIVEPVLVDAELPVTDEKSVTPTLKKFDQALFDAARTALASLIQVEAEEAKEGSDESHSFATLFTALQALMAWFDGEEAEGETEESIEMADAPDVTCKECGKTEKMCKCDKFVAAETEKSVDKCLECGCHSPADSHGSADVTTAEMVEEKSSTTILPRIDVHGNDIAERDLEEDEDSAEKSADVVSLRSVETDIINKAVSQATESVKAEFDILKSANKAAEEKIASLETELTAAKSLAVATGPKRTASAAGTNPINELLVKASHYDAKAATTTDPVLAKGYRVLADEYRAKSLPSN